MHDCAGPAGISKQGWLRWGRNRRLSPQRRLSVEPFEPRRLLALTITAFEAPVAVSPQLDPAVDLVFHFNQPVVKGNGAIYVIGSETGEAAATVQVSSAAVRIDGSRVTVDLPLDLDPASRFSVAIDPGGFLSTTGGVAGSTLLTQDFEFADLDPFVTESGGDGSDFSTVSQLGFALATPLDPARGIPEWRGFSFADKDSWIAAAGNQSRDQFTRGQGTILVADTDEYDDGNAAESPWVGSALTPAIDLSGVTAGSVIVEFDSSFRPEGPVNGQTGVVEVTFDGGTNWRELLRLDSSNTSNAGSNAVNLNLDERLVSGATSSVTSDGFGGVPFAAVENPATGSMQLRFTVRGTNDWWWAIDNLLVTGEVRGVPFGGLTVGEWSFTTGGQPALAVSLDPETVSEGAAAAAAHFDDTFTGSPSLDWSLIQLDARGNAGPVTNATVQVVDNALVLAGDPRGLLSGDYAEIVGGFIGELRDQRVEVQVASLPTATTLGGSPSRGNNDALLLTRFDTASGSGYAALLDMFTGRFELLSLVDLAETSLAAGQVPGFDPTVAYTMIMSVVENQLTASVIEAGASGPAFTLTATNDTHSVGLTGVAARLNLDVPSFADVTLVGTIIDDFSAVSLEPSVFGTVSRTGSLASELTVSLTSDDTTTATVPATVTIPAGAAFLRFPVAVIDDAVVDGTQRATVMAAAAGFSSAQATLTVLDNDSGGGAIHVGPGQTVTDSTVLTGDTVLVKRGGGTLVLTLAHSHTGGLVVEEGEVVIRNAAALNGGPLDIRAGARVMLDTGVSRVPVSAVMLDAAGRLDVARAGLAIAAGGFDAAAVRQAIVAGRSGGTWTGTSGITSTAAASTAGRAVGYAPGSNGSLVVAFAASGDTNLDGQVSVVDLVAIQSSGVYGTGAAAAWFQGDSNYDGVVSVVDMVAMQSSGVYGQGNYNPAPASQAAAASSQATVSTVTTPEAPSIFKLAFASLAEEQGPVSKATKKAFTAL
jgi:autotransporter-associated beta strand protein